MEIKTISPFLMAAFYIAAGCMHFIKPEFYVRIMPPYIPFHRAMVFISGLFEIGLGAGLLHPLSRSYSALGLIVLLTAVFPANVQMLNSRKAGAGLPRWLLWFRLPLQGLLLLWAWWHV